MTPVVERDGWLLKEMQKVTNQIIRRRYRPMLALRAKPTVVISRRLTATGGRFHSANNQIVISALYHRDHGMDETLLILKHEIAHWVVDTLTPDARTHGPEFKAVAMRLDPKIMVYCKRFAYRERKKVERGVGGG